MSITTKIGKVLKAPLILLVLASFGASIYAAANAIQGITYSVPVILGLILILYIIGMFLDRRANDNEAVTNQEYYASE
jgi:uncharacterized membrane protein YkvI